MVRDLDSFKILVPFRVSCVGLEFRRTNVLELEAIVSVNSSRRSSPIFAPSP